ncbi:MAG: alpha/beta fold hydrolase [Patescibacteria group bacterium]
MINSKPHIEVFTTRPDTLYGVTYMVLSPEHELIADFLPQIANRQEVEGYIKKAKAKSDLERAESKEKTGVELKGIKAINPVNNEEIPIFVADYVLSGYGTGAIMAVPGHDERDFEFAKKYDLPVINVIEPVTGTPKKNEEFRRSIVALVKNPKNGRILALNWGSGLGGYLLIGGGLEKGEDPVACAKREIKEETGYKNLKFIAQSEKIHHHYTAHSKNVDREIEVVGLYFELMDEEKGITDRKDNEKFKVIWLSEKEADQKVKDPLHHYVFDKFIRGKIYAGDGIMINSGKYNGMDSVKFKEIIIKDLNSTDGQKTKTCLVVHGIGGHEKENWFPWLKKELGQKGWEVIVPSLSDTDHPTMAVWNEQLARFDEQINEQSVLVGHSLGCPAMLYHLQLLGKNVHTVILVAPTNPWQKWTELRHSHPTADWKAVEAMNESGLFNWKKIRALAERFIIMFSDNDPFIPVESVEYYKKNLPEAEFHLFSGKHHFSKSNGNITVLPEILPFFPNQSFSLAKAAVNYKLRDWIFSRQHYWGEPIPLIHCEKCGVVPVPEKDLPVELPEVKEYEPTNTGESPLAKITEWVNVKCPKCGGQAKRETDTMPNWAGSNWYFIRYCDPHNDKKFADMKNMKHWLPVDLYNGGMEHTTLHLLYSRFWYKALYDLKLVPTDEPYKRRVSHGMVLAEDGRKMSKSFGNVVNPDVIIKEFGADAVRLYEMFMGPFDQAINWNTDGLRGMKRFLDRIQKHFQTNFGTQDLETKKYGLNKTVKKVTEDIDNLHFNTAVSALMKLINIYINLGNIEENSSKKDEREIYCKLLSPFAPHLAEELWEKLGHKESIFKEKWPSYDSKLVKDEEVEFIIQVNGKLRERLRLPADISESEAKEKALSSEKVRKYVIGEPKKVIFVKGRLINFVV